MSEKLNAAIFILTQNTEVRKVYLKTSLYFLFKNFNAEYKYPVNIFHEGDYDLESQREIITSIRSSCRDCVTFRTLDDGDFEYPDFIDPEKVKKCVALKVTPYWRTEKYRMMCYWWLKHMPKYAKGYDYVMRIDDDSIIEEQIPDLFKWADEKELVFASNLLHVDCGICCYGMKEFFDKKFPDMKEIIDKLFVKQDIPARLPNLYTFRSLLSIIKDPLPEISAKMPVYAPIMYYNNFFITKTEFWHRPEVEQLVDEIARDGGIFYLRYGDAPLQTLITMLLGGTDKVSRAVFKYSKRMQRESFKGDDSEYHSYMPEFYHQTSCITDNTEKKQE